jgi:nucleoside-diphosphate-sugar epimerase
LPSDIDIVVHAAGEKLDSAKMMATNVEGTRRLAEAAAQAGVRRFVHISSVGVYGATPHSGVVNETFVRHPRNQYEQSKEKGERSVRQVCEESGMQCLILQPSNVIAVNALAVSPLLGFLSAIRSGRLVRFGTSDAWLNYVAVEDVAAAVLDAAVHAPAGGTYIVNTPERLEDVVAWSATALGVPQPKWRAPTWIGSVAARLGDLASALGSNTPFDSNRLLELSNSTRFDGTSLSRATGFEYRFGVRMLISQLVGRYKTEGRL